MNSVNQVVPKMHSYLHTHRKINGSFWSNDTFYMWIVEDLLWIFISLQRCLEQFKIWFTFKASEIYGACNGFSSLLEKLQWINFYPQMKQNPTNEFLVCSKLSASVQSSGVYLTYFRLLFHCRSFHTKHLYILSICTYQTDFERESSARAVEATMAAAAATAASNHLKQFSYPWSALCLIAISNWYTSWDAFEICGKIFTFGSFFFTLFWILFQMRKPQFIFQWTCCFLSIFSFRFHFYQQYSIRK